MKARIIIFWVCLLGMASVVCDTVSATVPQADTITREELVPLLGRPDVVVIDLRTGRDWTDAALKIKGAVREDPMKPGMWMDKYPKEKMLVFYCA